jgi:uncharacterized protein with PQ loop repeat
MNVASMVFEGIMLVCFGISWPFAIYKTFKTKNVEGVSIIFLWFVFFGYISGILFKVFEVNSVRGPSPVMALYILNFLMVGTELVLYYFYKKKISV